MKPLFNNKCFIAFAVAAVIAAAFAAWTLCSTFLTSEEHIIYINEHEPALAVKEKVECSPSGVKNAVMRFILKQKGYYQHIRPGRYDIGSGASVISVFRNLRNGSEAPVHLTLRSLRTVDDLANLLGEKFMPSADDFATALRDSVFLDSLGLRPETAMCLFIPNTYDIYWSSTPQKLLERMHREYEHFWTDERQSRLDGITPGFTREQAITLASIVECETANAAEKPTVAGLYINRLHQGIKLQADPTVKFAVGDFTLRRILNRHLSVDSPYNTYRNAGLPPGPICTPSPQSIDAVLNYQHHDYIFMCAKEDFSGTHNFASNDVQHMQNAAKYQQALNARGIKK